MTIEDLRSSFPILNTKVYNKPLVYLDNAATMQRPISVIEYWDNCAKEYNANIHRAVHYLGNKATNLYETARDEVKNFIGAAYREEIIFTSGTTASINLVAFCFGEAFIQEGDEIIVTVEEHHSNIVPWQMMCERKKALLKVWDIDNNGELCINKLKDLISPKTKLLAMAQVSNVLGIYNPVAEATQICHSRGVKILVDGAQGIIHQQVNVKKEGFDFYVFSGHKIFASTGTGILYGKKELLEQIPPYMGGGEMIANVNFTKTTYAALPYKFEAGTPNIAGVATWIPAIQLIKAIREDNTILPYHEEVKDYVYNYLSNNKNIILFGRPLNKNNKIALFSFAVKGVHHEDLALLLDKFGIATRSGQVCAEPLMDRLNVTGILRASFAVYNTKQEAEYFIQSLEKAINMLRS